MPSSFGGHCISGLRRKANWGKCTGISCFGAFLTAFSIFVTFDTYHLRGRTLAAIFSPPRFVSSGKRIRNECPWTRPVLRQPQDERRAPPIVIPRVGAVFSVAISHHFCLIMVEGGNRSREEPGVSGGFRFPPKPDWQGRIGFFVASLSRTR